MNFLQDFLGSIMLYPDGSVNVLNQSLVQWYRLVYLLQYSFIIVLKVVVRSIPVHALSKAFSANGSGWSY